MAAPYDNIQVDWRVPRSGLGRGTSPTAASRGTTSSGSDDADVVVFDGCWPLAAARPVAEVRQLAPWGATKAHIRRDVSTYFFSLIRHEDDHVLMSPFGGEPKRGVDVTPEALEALERYFRSGSAELEVVQTFASGDMVVLVAIERQHGLVGGLPEQDWSLRVSLRRDEFGWRQVHRHADALVHGIDLDQLSALAQERHSASD